MFNWFKDIFNKDQVKEETPMPIKVEGPKDLEKTMIPPLPQLPQHTVNDHYRVGYDSQMGVTTLTLMSDGASMTLSLSPYELLRLIRILGATLDEDFIDEVSGDDFDDED
jgi:hypothetical protein